MKPIKEFVREYFDSSEDSELKDWNEILESSGYYRIRLSFRELWQSRDTAQWCREKFGMEHYYWTGGSFWFEKEEDAVMFALRWL